jgi:hypothetical protein
MTLSLSHTRLHWQDWKENRMPEIVAFRFPKCSPSFFNHFLWYRVGIWCVPTGNQNKNSIDFLCWLNPKPSERESSKSKYPWLPLGVDTNFQDFTRRRVYTKFWSQEHVLGVFIFHIQILKLFFMLHSSSYCLMLFICKTFTSHNIGIVLSP